MRRKESVKEKNYVVLSFKQKQVTPFEKMKNHQYFANTLSSEKCDLFLCFWPKTGTAGLEIFHKKSCILTKHLKDKKIVVAAVHFHL